MISLTPDQQKKGAAIGGFVLLALGILYYELHDDSPAPVAAPVVVTAPVKVGPAVVKTGSAGVGVPAVAVAPGSAVGTAAKKTGTTSAQLDPTLRMEAMLVTESLVYSGSGRNIFSATSAPIDIPKPVAPVRPKGPVVPVVVASGGTAATTADRSEVLRDGDGGEWDAEAFLLHGDDVFLASDGDIVQRRYKVISISANSIVVEDMANNNRQTLPLLAR